MDIETENIEFKSGFTEEIYKEIIAFANTDGGVLYIGIDNDGNAVVCVMLMMNIRVLQMEFVTLFFLMLRCS